MFFFFCENDELTSFTVICQADGVADMYTVALTSGSSTSTTSQRLTSVMMHLTDSDYDMKAQST